VNFQTDDSLNHRIVAGLVCIVSLTGDAGTLVGVEAGMLVESSSASAGVASKRSRNARRPDFTVEILSRSRTWADW
jgi:hypothetical protein